MLVCVWGSVSGGLARDSLTEKLTFESRSKGTECVSLGVSEEREYQEERALRQDMPGVLKEQQRSGCS